MVPPAVVRDSDVLELGSSEHWIVSGALYGFQESPYDWAIFRDNTMKTISWKALGIQYRIQASGEPHLWKVIARDPNNTIDTTVGYVPVYVDDILIAASDMITPQIRAALSERFQLAEPQQVTQQQTVTFCGYEITKTANGFKLSQRKRIQDLLPRRGITTGEPQPGPKISEGDEEQNPSASDIKLAQALTGELMWISSRTRPDLAYTTGLMSRLIHKPPRYTAEIGFHALRYLFQSEDQQLHFTACPEDKMEILQVFVDASFGPPHEGFRSVQGMLLQHGDNPLMWASTRQAFIAQSTSEAELLACNESLQCGESLMSLLEVMEYHVRSILKGDCTAAISQLTLDTGSWRTRHLRLRSAKLRECIQDPIQRWTVEHCDGAVSGRWIHQATPIDSLFSISIHARTMPKSS